MPSEQESLSPVAAFSKDLLAGLIVFLVALPLCLGIALASGAPMESGLIAGVVGGIVVGFLSGSQTSVSGPAAGLTAIVASQISSLGAFETFLLAVVVGGVFQVVLGLVKAGSLSAFFPSSVIKGLLAAIGVIILLKQLPHLLGDDKDPEGEMSFQQPDHENTFTEIINMFANADFHLGAMTVGLVSLVFLIFWDQIKVLKKSLIPAPLLVVVGGVLMGLWFRSWGGQWLIQSEHLVQVPVAADVSGLSNFLRLPDFSQLGNLQVYVAGMTLAVVASLETLLNLDATDKMDKRQRLSPPSRELWAQGVGNILSGLMGGLPMTSVIIRSSVNINAGSQTKVSAIVHGLLLAICVIAMPTYLNLIPLSCLAAILMMTGFKLASVKLFKGMWKEGPYQFLPFLVTLVAIVLTDLLIGIVIGLGVSVAFILFSNLKQPIRFSMERHPSGELTHLQLANQVSFLNRAALEQTMRGVPKGGHLLLDARQTDYIDPDILSLIREFSQLTGPTLGVQVSLLGFRERGGLQDNFQFSQQVTPELHQQFAPSKVLELLQEGNRRYAEGKPLKRDFGRRADQDAAVGLPLAVFVTGIDSWSPIEMIFDLGIGDAFTVRMPANVIGNTALGGIEYATRPGKAKLIVVMGQGNSPIVASALQSADDPDHAKFLAECPNLVPVLEEVRKAVPPRFREHLSPRGVQLSPLELAVRCNVNHSIAEILARSPTVGQRVAAGDLKIVGAIYRIESGQVLFLDQESSHD